MNIEELKKELIKVKTDMINNGSIELVKLYISLIESYVIKLEQKVKEIS